MAILALRGGRPLSPITSPTYSRPNPNPPHLNRIPSTRLIPTMIGGMQATIGDDLLDIGSRRAEQRGSQNPTGARCPPTLGMGMPGAFDVPNVPDVSWLVGFARCHRGRGRPSQLGAVGSCLPCAFLFPFVAVAAVIVALTPPPPPQLPSTPLIPHPLIIRPARPILPRHLRLGLREQGRGPGG